MRNRSIPQKRDVFCIFLTKTSLFPFGFKNDFYVICALTAVLVEYVMSDDRSFQSVDHSSEIETAVCDVPVKHLLCRLHLPPARGGAHIVHWLPEKTVRSDKSHRIRYSGNKSFAHGS